MGAGEFSPDLLELPVGPGEGGGVVGALPGGRVPGGGVRYSAHLGSHSREQAPKNITKYTFK